MENSYLIPTDKETVEKIAMAIAKDRMRRDASNLLEDLTGMRLPEDVLTDQTIDRVFDTLWNGNSQKDIRNRKDYREDALAAIRAINLNLLTTISKQG